MNPIDTPEANRTFVLPGGTSRNDLRLQATVDEGDRPILVSVWELTDEERQQLLWGGRVVLTVWGITTPPVALSVTPA